MNISTILTGSRQKHVSSRIVFFTGISVLAVIFLIAIPPYYFIICVASAEQTPSLNTQFVSQEGLPGENLVFTIECTNLSGLFPVFVIFNHESGIVAWADKLVVGNSETGGGTAATTDIYNITIRIPANASAGTSFPISTTLRSPDEQVVRLNLTVTVRPKVFTETMVEYLPVKLGPDARGSCLLIVKNRGSITGSFTFDIIGLMPSVNYSFEPLLLSIPPGGEGRSLLKLDFSGILMPASVNFTVLVLENNYLYNERVNITVYGKDSLIADLSPANSTTLLKPGESFPFQFTMKNNGAVAGEFKATVNGSMPEGLINKFFTILLENDTAVLGPAQSSKVRGVLTFHDISATDDLLQPGSVISINIKVRASSVPADCCSTFILYVQVARKSNVSIFFVPDTFRIKTGETAATVLNIVNNGNYPECLWLDLISINSWISSSPYNTSFPWIIGPCRTITFPMRLKLPPDIAAIPAEMKLLAKTGLIPDLSKNPPPSIPELANSTQASVFFYQTRNSSFGFRITPSIKEVYPGQNASFGIQLYNNMTEKDNVEIDFYLNNTTRPDEVNDSVFRGWLNTYHTSVWLSPLQSRSLTLIIRVPNSTSPQIIKVDVAVYPGGAPYQTNITQITFVILSPYSSYSVSSAWPYLLPVLLLISVITGTALYYLWRRLEYKPAEKQGIIRK